MSSYLQPIDFFDHYALRLVIHLFETSKKSLNQKFKKGTSNEPKDVDHCQPKKGKILITITNNLITKFC